MRYVNDDDVLKVIERFIGYLDEDMIERIKMKISAIPTAEERPHGEWIFEKGDGKTCCDGWGCSFCGRTFHTRVPYFAEFLFCPNCGADMREGEAE